MRTLLPTILVLAAAAAAQTTTPCVHASTTSSSTGFCNVIPFGGSTSSATWINQKYQTLVPATLIKSQTGLIRELSFASCGTGTHHFDSIKIIMDNTSKTVLDKTFANNLSARATTVLDARNYDWQITKDQWNPIGLQKPFLRTAGAPLGPNIVIDIEIRGARGVTSGFHRAGSSGTPGVERSYAFGWSLAAGPPTVRSGSSTGALHVKLCYELADLSSYGIGCQGSNKLVPTLGFTGIPKISQKVTIDLGNAPTTGAAVFLAGFSNAGGLPVDLKIFNAPGCMLYVSPDLPIPAPVVGGKASLPFTVPNDKTLPGTKLYGQFLVVDPTANGFGMTTSNYVRALIGP